jgi:protein-tyrosine phosphatase
MPLTKPKSDVRKPMAVPTHADVIPGTWNFRDIGGILTPDGPVRHGQVYRSAVLAELDPAGLDALEKLGVTNVFDLRGPREIDRDGSDRVPETVTVTIAPFHSEGDETPVHEVTQGAAPLTQADRVRAYYAAIPVLALAQQSMAALLRAVADSAGAVLVHCAAGKDRTGWAIATLLTLLGADRDAVLADYLLSNTAIESLRSWLQAQYGDAFLADQGVLGVDASFLQAAWDSMERNFGSFDGYLQTIGIDDEVVDRIRARLIG